MKVTMFRTLFWNIELPDTFQVNPKNDHLDPEAVKDYLDKNDAWPSLLDGEDIDEIEVVQIKED